MGQRKIKAFEKLAELLYPSDVFCYACGEETFGKGKNLLCKKCLEKLEKAKNPKTYGQVGTFSYCMYGEFSRNMILRAKDGDEPHLLRVMATCVNELLAAEGISGEEIAYVPSMKKTVRRRGYDHMKKEARVLSELTGIPVLKGLKRVSVSADQTALKYEERFENVKNDFCYDGEDLSGKTIILIDDVVTSGATLNACAVALRKANPTAVIGVTFARSHE